MFRFLIGILLCGFGVRAEAEPLSELSRKLAEHYRDNPIEAVLTPELQREIATLQTSELSQNLMASRVANRILAARLRQIASLRGTDGEPLFSASELERMRTSYSEVRREKSKTRINGQYSPVSKEFGNQTSSVQIPEELSGTWIFHAIKLHETEHFIQHELAKKWGMGSAYGTAMDRLMNTDPGAVFVSEYGSMGIEGLFVGLIPASERRALRATVDSLKSLDSESRSFAERLLSFSRGGPDAYRNLHWHRGRYGWDKIAPPSWDFPAELGKILPATRAAFTFGKAVLACANLYRGVKSLLGF